MEILFGALDSLLTGLRALIAPGPGELLVFGAVPFVLYAMTLLFEVRALSIAILAIVLGGLPFGLRLAIGGAGTEPFFANPDLVPGILAAAGFALVMLLSLVSALPPFRVRGHCRSFAFYLFALGMALVILVACLDIAGYDATGGPFADASFGAGLGALIGLAAFILLISLVPAVIGAIVPIAGAAKPVHMLFSVAAAGVAGWFLFMSVGRVQTGLAMIEQSPAL